MRTFEMVRKEDESGVSGTGKVLEGVVFSDGITVGRWVSDKSPARSTTFYNSFGEFIAIHVAPHPTNKTEIKFSDGEVYEHTKVTTAATGAVSKTRRKRKAVLPKVAVGDGQPEVPVQPDATN